MTNPYENLAAEAFWRTGVLDCHPLRPDALYTKKFEIAADDRVATAGSCFAQHIAKAMRSCGIGVLDVEPAPKGLPAGVWGKYGFGMYSGRYSNIYTARQLRQLIEEAFLGKTSPDPVWEKDGRFFDSMRPAVEPRGLLSADEVLHHRRFHLARVRQLFSGLDVFVFTLGLTECWRLVGTDWIFPTAPGTLAGSYDPERYVFHNLGFTEVMEDLIEALDIIGNATDSKSFRVLLTVSPVPLTATRSGEHVLTATTYSKSVLRSVAGELSLRRREVGYFPSYEIATSPWSRGIYFDTNLRTINEAGVSQIMSSFMRCHFGESFGSGVKGYTGEVSAADVSGDVQCEEALLEAFGRKSRMA